MSLDEKYHIDRLLSSDKNADVYYGEILGISGFRRPITIKRFKNLSPKKSKHLAEDATLSGLLNHANIVQILDFGQWSNGEWTIVMEYIPGKSLKDLIYECDEQGRKLPKDLIQYIILEIITGIEYCHRQQAPSMATNILHRNLQPSNILIDNHGSIKIKGFSQDSNMGADNIFIAPDAQLDHRSDIWGIGAILHTMIHGLSNTDPLRTNTSMPKDSLERIAQQALHPNPNNRFQSASAMKEALLHQCGEINIQSHDLLRKFMLQPIDLPNITGNFDSTYVSKTINKKELNLQITKKMETPIPTPLPTQVQVSSTDAVETSTQTQPEISTFKSWGIVGLGTLIGILLGFIIAFAIKIPQYTPSDQSEVHWHFPNGSKIKVLDKELSKSGTKITVPSNTTIRAEWIIAPDNIQELQFQLSPGEARWITLEYFQQP